MSLLFATGTNKELAKSVAAKSGWQLGKAELGRFADGEVKFELESEVKGEQVAVIGSTNPPAENLIELFAIINTLKINGAKEVLAVVPYFGYAKSDRVERKNVPVNARLMAQFIQTAGADKVVAINLHSDAVVNFFSLPLVHLSAIPLLGNHFSYLGEHGDGNLAVVAPDLGGEKRARELADFLGVKKIVVIEKFRPRADQAQVVKVHDGVENRDVILVDDFVQTGGTLIAAAQALKERGAKDIYVALCHFVFSAGGMEKLTNSGLFKEIVITDTIPAPRELSGIFKVLSVESILSNALKLERQETGA